MREGCHGCEGLLKPTYQLFPPVSGQFSGGTCSWMQGTWGSLNQSFLERCDPRMVLQE